MLSEDFRSKFERQSEELVYLQQDRSILEKALDQLATDNIGRYFEIAFERRTICRATAAAQQPSLGLAADSVPAAA